MQKLHIASSDQPVTLYGLDVILAVGHRVARGDEEVLRRPFRLHLEFIQLTVSDHAVVL